MLREWDADSLETTPVIPCQGSPGPPARAPDPRRVQPRMVQRRTHVRWRCELSALCRQSLTGNEGVWWHATVRDVSVGGLRLLIAHWFTPQTYVQIQLGQDESGEPVTRLARVIHAAALRTGGWAIGCAFVSALTDRQLRALLLEADKAVESVERRSSLSLTEPTAGELWGMQEAPT